MKEYKFMIEYHFAIIVSTQEAFNILDVVLHDNSVKMDGLANDKVKISFVRIEDCVAIESLLGWH